jgi:hypothetical protein
MKVAWQSSLREGRSGSGGLNSRWGGDGADGRSGQEARGAGGGSVSLERDEDGEGSEKGHGADNNTFYRRGGGVDEQLSP